MKMTTARLRLRQKRDVVNSTMLSSTTVLLVQTITTALGGDQRNNRNNDNNPSHDDNLTQVLVIGASISGALLTCCIIACMVYVYSSSSNRSRSCSRTTQSSRYIHVTDGGGMMKLSELHPALVRGDDRKGGMLHASRGQKNFRTVTLGSAISHRHEGGRPRNWSRQENDDVLGTEVSLHSMRERYGLTQKCSKIQGKWACLLGNVEGVRVLYSPRRSVTHRGALAVHDEEVEIGQSTGATSDSTNVDMINEKEATGKAYLYDVAMDGMPGAADTTTATEGPDVSCGSVRSHGHHDAQTTEGAQGTKMAVDTQAETSSQTQSESAAHGVMNRDNRSLPSAPETAPTTSNSIALIYPTDANTSPPLRKLPVQVSEFEKAEKKFFSSSTMRKTSNTSSASRLPTAAKKVSMSSVDEPATTAPKWNSHILARIPTHMNRLFESKHQETPLDTSPVVAENVPKLEVGFESSV